MKGKIDLARGLWTLGVAFSVSGLPLQAGIDRELASRHFQEASSMCAQEGGHLWNLNLCGPILFVDPRTREIAANEIDEMGHLKEQSGVFSGLLPESVNCANTATDWAGKRWTMILWPLPESDFDRRKLMAHELFHRVQDGIGLPMSNPSNSHLDSQAGRIWLQLEWRALAVALRSQGVERAAASRDALSFRAWRRQLFEDAADEERALEMNEGLAEYTGFRLAAAGRDEREELVAEKIARASDRPSFVRSFAYETGPAYGVLLDSSDPDWREDLDPEDDLGEILSAALDQDSSPLTRERVLARAALYDGATLIESERRREENRESQRREYRSRLVEGPVLLLEAGEGLRYSFNPSNLIPLDENRTIYPTLRVVDAWGILEVEDGALAVKEKGRMTGFRVPAPDSVDEGVVVGRGYRLDLTEDWVLSPAERPGDLIVQRKK